MATLASTDIDILTAIERSAFYRRRYVEQIAANAELKAACRLLFTKWDEGKPSLNQVLERIRTLIEKTEPPVPLPCASCDGKGVIEVGRTPELCQNCWPFEIGG